MPQLDLKLTSEQRARLQLGIARAMYGHHYEFGVLVSLVDTVTAGAAGLSTVEERFTLAEVMRDCADQIERIR